MSNVYDIRQISDFSKVPTHRLPACMGEFVNFLLSFRNAPETQEAGLIFDSFQWKDDGIDAVEGIQLELMGPNHEVISTEFIPNPQFPQKGA